MKKIIITILTLSTIALHSQSYKRTDLKVNDSTLNVDATTNRVGIGTIPNSEAGQNVNWRYTFDALTPSSANVVQGSRIYGENNYYIRHDIKNTITGSTNLGGAGISLITDGTQATFMSFSENSTDAARAGRTILSTASSNSAGILFGTVGNHDIEFTAYSDGSTTPDMVISGSNVGIGTSEPSEKLEILNGHHVVKSDDGGTNYAMTTEHYSNTSTRSGRFKMYRSGGTSSSKTTVLNGYTLGLVTFQGFNGTNDSDLGARFGAYATDDWATGDTPAKLQFETTPNGSGSSVARMTILDNGNVGIGTTSPDSKLEVNGNGLFSGNLTVNGTTLTSDIVIQNEETNTNPAELNLYKKNGSNIGEVTVGDNIGSINFKAESGVTTVTSASIEVDATTLYNNEIGGDMVFKTASEFHSRPLTEAMRIDKLGMVGIGTSSPSETLDVDGNARFRSIGSGASAGALHYTSDGTLTTNTSDVRLKTNLQPLENTLNKLLGINTYTFNWIDETDRVDLGMIAQEVEQIFPNLVFTNNVDGYKGIHYDKFSSILTKAIQEQQAIIETQEQKITDLETTIQSLITRIENLENK
jgi:hypothetical protein